MTRGEGRERRENYKRGLHSITHSETIKQRMFARTHTMAW